MEHARSLEAVAADESPLAHARLKRQLTIDETAKRAGVSPEELQWIEEGRLYRFPTPDRALLVTLLCATALGIDHREALELAGLPTPPLLPAHPLRRFAALGAGVALVVAAILAIVLAQGGSSPKPSVAASAAKTLPAPWAISVVVLNGNGDLVWTRQVASRIQALSYRIVKVAKATSFNYPQTEVYYPPGAEGIATRLAKQLAVPVQPLPGGTNPRRLVVIVGPRRLTGN
jgi:transcriptional regulator with XRE-family HTH domain